MNDELQRRSLFRAVNERIREINRVLAEVEGRYEVVCECGRSDCVARIEVPSAVFEDVRAHGARYVVAPGHEAPGVDRVLTAGPAHVVVALEPTPQ